MVIEVTDLSPGGLTSTFTVNFEFIPQLSTSTDESSEGDNDETLDSESDEEDEAAATAILLAQQSKQKDYMQSIIESALTAVKSPAGDAETEEIVIEATLREIDTIGSVFIDFSPKAVLVPNDWKRMWDLAEREKLSLKDREAYEKELTKIMHVTFEQNSDELPQRYILSNLTNFESGGISIYLNFSDPLLISQGPDADKINIKLLKSYFLQPDPLQSKGYTRSL